MTALESLIKSVDLGSICIKNGTEVLRIKYNKAYPLLNDGWKFASKKEYKQYCSINPKIEIKKEEVLEPVIKKEKVKAKDRKKKNEKK